MTKRENGEVTIRELDNKLDGIIKQLGAVQELQLNLHKHLTDFIGWTEQLIEERRKEAAEEEKKLQIHLNYQSLLLGLFIGIIGNLFVSYFIEALKVFNMSPWDFVYVTIISGILMFILAYPFYRKIKSLSKSIKKT